MEEESLPIDVSELGEVLSAKSECPGVYYVQVKPDGSKKLVPDEYYLVLDGAPISNDARSYGTMLRNGQGLIFSLDQEYSGSKVVEYEVYKYRLSHGLPLPDGESLHECAAYGAELHPGYFGMPPVPLVTPWGYTTRNRTLANGIYWLETDQCVETLAVSYPIWKGDLSSVALRYARQNSFDIEHDIDQTMGYQFFPQRAICVAVFELLQTREEWIWAKKVDVKALMNSIWDSCPEYAVVYNANEQNGMHDYGNLLMRLLGYDAALSGDDKNMISMDPTAGTQFWRW